MVPLCDLARAAGFPVPQLEELDKIGSTEAEPVLVELLGHPDPDVRDHALRALHRIDGTHVVDAAITAWDDPHPLVRDRAARVLVRHDDHRAVPRLILLCDGPHAAAAAAALTRLGDPRALPTLWHLFGTARDRATRHAAGRGLARIDGPQHRVGSDDPRVRRAYTWLLGHKPEWQPEDRLSTDTGAADPLVRARAAEAFGRLGDPAGADHVRALLTDPDPRVRATATAALRRLEAQRSAKA
ncbi:MAG TPA: HEAT repeat domain-containing protein [Umezawaea sp.]|nr:HEAT repeat domain-containing protein [Umezawaea sp.]